MFTKKTALAAVLSAMAQWAAASPDCSSGSQAPLKLQDWSITVQDQSLFQFAATVVNVTNTAEKDVVALDGNVQFFDPLDRFVISLRLPEVVPIAAGETVDVGGDYPSDKLESLGAISPDLVTVIVCTKEAAYGDGSKEAFD